MGLLRNYLQRGLDHVEPKIIDARKRMAFQKHFRGTAPMEITAINTDTGQIRNIATNRCLQFLILIFILNLV
jgi:hypothetical protein